MGSAQGEDHKEEHQAAPPKSTKEKKKKDKHKDKKDKKDKREKGVVKEEATEEKKGSSSAFPPKVTPLAEEEVKEEGPKDFLPESAEEEERVPDSPLRAPSPGCR